MTKLKYCYSHPKSFVFMFWIVLFMFLNHKSIPHTPNPLFPSNFLLFFPNTFPNLFQILHCFMNHKPRQFRPPLSPFFFSFFFAHSLPVCIQNAVQHQSCFFFNKEIHIATHPFSTHHTISIFSVLPQCDSAMNILSIHPSLITLLLNQLSERNHTTVLRFHSYF